MKSYLQPTSSKMPSSLLTIIPVLCSLLALQTNFVSINAIEAWNMSDTSKYPACLGDSECNEHDSRKQLSKNHHACFQYFCYPWQQEATTADKTKELLFKGCRKNSQCKVNGKKGHCYRHPDKRRISKGICLKGRPNTCDTHDECIGFGGKCCNGFCCKDVYFDAIKGLPCLNDEGCQDMLAGDRCCLDISGGGSGWKTGKANWDKRCCEPSNGQAVIPPPKTISDKKIRNIGKTIEQMGQMGNMKETLCQSMNYELMVKFGECTQFTTTTRAPTTTTPPTTTTKPPTTTLTAKGLTTNAATSIISYATTKLVLTIISLNLLLFSF